MTDWYRLESEAEINPDDLDMGELQGYWSWRENNPAAYLEAVRRREAAARLAAEEEDFIAATVDAGASEGEARDLWSKERERRIAEASSGDRARNDFVRSIHRF